MPLLICMGPTSSIQPGFRFFNLKSGKTIVRRCWDRLPMPDSVIARVNRLGAGQPKHLTFTDRHGDPIGDLELPGVGDEPIEPDEPAGVDTDEAIDDAPEDLEAHDEAEVDEDHDNVDATDNHETVEAIVDDATLDEIPVDEIPGVA